MVVFSFSVVLVGVVKKPLEDAIEEEEEEGGNGGFSLNLGIIAVVNTAYKGL